MVTELLTLRDLRVQTLKERKEGRLTKIPNSFFDQIKNLENQIRNVIEQSKNNVKRLEKSNSDMRKLMDLKLELHKLRERKLTDLAREKVNGQNPSSENVHSNESEYLESICSVIEKHRENTLLSTDFEFIPEDKPDLKKEATVENKEEDQVEENVEIQTQENINESIDDQSDNSEYLNVKVLEDLPTFTGMDAKNYTLKSGDTESIPKYNARMLSDAGKVKLVTEVNVLTYEKIKNNIIVTDKKVAAQIYNKGNTGTPQSGGNLLLTSYEALYSNDRKDIVLTNEEVEELKRDKLVYYTYRDLKERGLVVKSDKKGLRLYDRNTSTKSASSAIVYSYNFQDNIDFSEVINELKAGFQRRTQIGIVDNEGDVVYYIANLIEWPKTKLKDNIENINDDPKMKELVDLGYQIHSGLKFGTHYRIYNYESEHAPWLIHITQKNHNWLDIARMIRVGHGVNKIIVLAYEKYWISLKWTKP